MQRRTLLATLVIFCFGIGFTYSVAGFFSVKNSEDIQLEKAEQSGAGKQLNMWFQARAYPVPDNLNQRYIDAWQTYLDSRELAGDPSTLTRVQAGSWSYIGPFTSIGGRVLCIAIDPADPDNLWAGTASGGLWKSMDAGANWQYVPISNFPVLGVSSVIIDPGNSNIMYAGTGEVYRNGNSNIGFNVWKARGTYGVGILKSVDKGVTWTQVLARTTPDMFAIQMLEFDPQVSTTIYAAATDGLYRSVNSGSSWTKFTTTINNLYIADVAIHPSNSNRITVAVGNLVDATKGVYYTSNGGTSWTAATGLPSFSGFIRLDYTGSSSLFASVGRGGSNDELYESTNFGQTWAVKNNSTHCGGQYWFSHDLAVNPFDIDSITMAGVQGYRYRVSDQSISGSIPTVHSDMHDIEYDPANRGRIYIACDGGIFRSNNGGVSWTNRNNGLGAVQFYASLGVSPTTPNIIIGGLQDNGVVRYNGSSWTSVLGGDGGPTAFHPNGTTVISSNDARAIHHSTSGGGSGSWNQRLSNLGISYGVDERTGFMAPLAISRSNPDIMYVGSDNLHISTDAGISFTRNTPASMTRPIEMTNKTAIALAVSPVNADKVYVSTSPFAQMADNTLLFNPPPNVLKSTNASSNSTYVFNSIRTGLPGRFVMDFAISRTNDDSVFVVLGGFEDAQGSHIFVTGNGGSTWSDIGTSGILPDVPFNAIAIDPLNPQVIYAACDFGVYVSPNRGASWLDFNNGFTGTNLVMDLQFSSDNLLVAATHGRGVAVSPRYNGVLPVFFSSFTGQQVSQGNQLNWSTTAENNVSHFELERSTDGSYFQSIARISARNNAAGGSYSQLDPNTTVSASYHYRVKAVDLDGTLSYTSIVRIQVVTNKSVTVHSNPFSESIRFSLRLPEGGPLSASLFDARGSLVREQRYFLASGISSIQLDGLSRVPGGVYFLRLEINGRVFNERLLKQ